jgi:hypothetical protein
LNLPVPIISGQAGLETLAQTWFAWFIATAFGYKYYYSISIIHVSRTRAGWKFETNKQCSPRVKNYELFLANFLM